MYKCETFFKTVIASSNEIKHAKTRLFAEYLQLEAAKEMKNKRENIKSGRIKWKSL